MAEMLRSGERIYTMSSETRAEKKEKYSQPPCLMTSLPEDRVYRVATIQHSPSFLSNFDHSRRSLLGCTEHCLYVSLYTTETCDRRLYILRRKANGSGRLVLIPWLPAVPIYASFVTVGSRIYVFSGIKNHTRSALTIDCGSHTMQPLPSMLVPLSHTIAGIIAGRIYVIGNHDTHPRKKAMVVFNTKTQKWEEPAMKKIDIKLGNTYYYGCVVMAGKMYTMDSDNSFVYDPKENKWERDGMLNLKELYNGCVIDDVLYYFDCDEKSIKTYDPKKRCWGVVNGLENLLAETIPVGWGMLSIFFP
ncbi:unnamed protein product [Thlaspi arvense]|uniref:FKB95-like N-terminal Kelch domain-containing protein n=1 Tax=Thlaspi arvense TaxID=13288 RepID=A0AAU9SD44_THLAR|nr:unnamed protein product [Thlaspi arvense]